MDQVRDPVCGMMVNPETAPDRATNQGETYYFCSPECREKFVADPRRYVNEEMEKHEPPYTEKGGWVAPKFGSAVSGGLENEPSPERHRK